MRISSILHGQMSKHHFIYYAYLFIALKFQLGFELKYNGVKNMPQTSNPTQRLRNQSENMLAEKFNVLSAVNCEQWDE